MINSDLMVIVHTYLSPILVFHMSVLVSSFSMFGDYWEHLSINRIEKYAKSWIPKFEGNKPISDKRLHLFYKVLCAHTK